MQLFYPIRILSCYGLYENSRTTLYEIFLDNTNIFIFLYGDFMPPWFDNLTAYLLNHLYQFYVNCDTKLYDCETNECIIFMKTFTEVNELNSMSPAI